MVDQIKEKTTDRIMELAQSIDELLVEVHLIDSATWPLDVKRVPLDFVVKTFESVSNLVDAREALIGLAQMIDKTIKRPDLPVDVCQCDDGDNSKCHLHTINHARSEGCCTEDIDLHRSMTEVEYDEFYPLLFDERVRVGDKTYRVDTRWHPRGAWTCLSILFSDNDEDGGLAFDIPTEALRAVLPLLEKTSSTDLARPINPTE